MESLNADAARQAIDAIRGYEYQVLAATLAWVDLDDDGLLCLEVAEDYATVVGPAIEAVQVKDTRSSGSVTLNTPAVRDALEAFVDLTKRNPDRRVQLRFVTTSTIGLEKATKDRPGGMEGLTYWERVRAGRQDVGPLRSILERDTFPDAVREFCTSRGDQALVEELIRRVTWDCGRPQAANLRQELERRLAQVLREKFNAPPQEASRVADILAYRVLQRSAMAEPQERELSRPELNELVDFATRVYLPRAGFEMLMRQAAANVQRLGPGQAVVSSQGDSDPSWVVDVAAVPALKATVSRPAIEAAAQSALNATGICLIVGPTGMGKSIVARTVASKYSRGARRIDFRDLESPHARERLHQLLGRLAGFASASIMIEDLNCIGAPGVQAALAQVVEAARRHDMRVLISCYRRPPVAVLNGLGGEPESVVTCPPFELEETCALVSHLGGDPSVWGQVAHIAGGSGHPQLTHTFAAGMASRDWPAEEIPQIVARGFTSGDLDDLRAMARTSMPETLREPTRHLLYRLSVATAPFKRSLAVALGTVHPPIPRPGECLDELVGPWLEAATHDRYRASPMVRGFGQDLLTAEELGQVHRVIAEETIRVQPIDAGDIDTVLVHGLAGRSEASLAKVSAAINVADDETRRALAAHSAVFPMLTTAGPIFSEHLLISVMLRLAQLRLATASDEHDGAGDLGDVVEALVRELDALPADLAGDDLETVVLVAILGNLGIANHVGSWVELLSRFRRLERLDDEGVLSPFPEVPTGAALFGIGTAGLASVEKLEAIFADLDAVGTDDRREWLTPVEPAYADYHWLVHGPWIAERRQANFDAAQAVASYETMARQANAWGVPTLGLQCCVAAAMILDECVGDLPLALRTLEGAARTFGEHPVLARAFGHLHHRSGQIEEALASYRHALSHSEASAPADATYTFRDAAVCAARSGEWDTARAWFRQAQALAEPLDTVGLRAIGIGLGADAGVASFEGGDLGGALGCLRDALLALESLDPDSSLQAAHCHRVVRHTILWLKSKVGQLDIEIQGEPITIRYGACSNPEPVPEIEQLPLGHIDFSWYMLAGIELFAGLDLGIREVVRQRGKHGQIPTEELALRLQTLGTTVERLDPESFSIHLLDYVAASGYCHVNMAALADSFDVMNPSKVIIPKVPLQSAFEPATEQAARHAILAYGARSLFNGHPGGVFELRDSLTGTLGQRFPGKSLFDDWTSLQMGAANLDDEVAAILALMCESDHPRPDLLFRIGVRLLDWVTQSSFKPFVMRDFAPWLRDQWRRVLLTQRFLLVTPSTSVPAIEDVLQGRSTGAQFAAKVALVASDAVGVPVARELRERLADLAKRPADKGGQLGGI